MSQLQVLSVTSEIYPLIKTGGLADVCGALPLALKAEDVDTATVIPGYPAVMGACAEVEEVHSVDNLFGGPARVLAARAEGLDLFVVDAPHLYDRPGSPYVAPDGNDWPDNAFRFAGLAKIAAEIGAGAVEGFVPDVVHAHDWQAGLTPAYLRYGGHTAQPATVVTIHNLAFQGQFPAELRAALDLPPESFGVDGIEHYGAIGFLKAALQLSDWITTVSPNYANEIQGIETGMGFDGLLRNRTARLSGILNGIDTNVWNPATDPRIAANFEADNLEPRAQNKAALQRAMGLDVDARAPLASVIARLSWQKGLDLLVDALPVLLAENMQLAVLGTGDPDLEVKFRAAAQAHPGRIGVHIGYDESLAHRIQAGADVLLVPSRYEPCGLTQLCALRYGAVPVVARVGGLADTIIDANEMALMAGVATGLQYAPVTAEALAAALRKTAALYRDTATWTTLQRNGMASDVSWRAPARRYATLYRNLIRARNS